MLKNFLRSLLEAFIEDKRPFISSQSAPAGETISYWGTIQNNSWSSVVAAPCDGYCMLFMQYGSVAEVSNITNGIRCKSQTSDFDAGICVPVKKGDLVNAFAIFTQATECWYGFKGLVGDN